VELRTPRAIVVESLTYEDVQERALAAVRQPNSVYHLTATTRSNAGEYRQDVWLDLDAGVGRRHNGGEENIDLQYGGRRAFVMEERFYDGPCEPCPEDEAAMLVPHLDWIVRDNYEDRSLDEAVVDGEPAIRVTVKREYTGESPGTATASIYLGEDFLPIRMDVNASGGRLDTKTEFDGEFIDRGALPADWFTPEALEALAGGPVSDVKTAADAGLDVYWLGTEFESMILRDESRFYPRDASPDGDVSLRLSYGPAEFSNPAPCASIQIARRGERESGFVPEGLAAFDEIELDGGSASLYRAPRPRLTVPPPHPDDPESDEPTTPFPGVVPAATAAPLTPVSGDTGEFFAAVIQTDDTVIEVATNCGPVGSNLYRTEDAFRRLVQSLEAYAAASP
jgi:hypothetical protein